MVTDKTRRSTFIEQNLGLVHSCAGRFRGRGIEYDDLYSAGCMGLVKAYDGFDESRGVCFSTYAVPVILGEIKRLEKQLAELEGTTNRFEEQLRGEKKWAELVKKYHNATEVTAEMVDAMIVSMKMNKDSSLSIEFNHMDEFKVIFDTIDILRKEVA